MRKALLASLVMVAMVAVAGTAGAQQYGYGPGMMQGYGMGPGMMGQGMMGQGMMGPGMMGPGMMGPGMMGGMMHGYGYGYGVDLTPEQRSKVLDIEQRFAQQNWDLMGKMHQQGYRGPQVYRDGKFDEQAARKNYEAMEVSRKQMFETWLKAQKEMDALLTPDQRQKMQRGWQGR